MKRLICIAVCCFLAISTFAQNPPTNSSEFNLQFNVASGPGGVGTDIAATAGITANLYGREDTLILPGVNGNYFGAGVQYQIPQVCDLLSATNINCTMLDFYVTGSAGVTRVPLAGAFVNHAAGMVGFGANYKLAGQWQLVADVHLARLPGMEQGWTPIIALGPTIKFGQNGAAAAQDELKRQKQAAKQRKRLDKLQKAAHWQG